MRQKTLIVGLDSACWEYVNPLLRSGQLPTLQRLMASGTWGTLNSTIPPWTPTAWASIITGKNPGKHGIFDMLWRQPGTYQFTPTNAKVRRGTPFWYRLNEHGIRVGLVNLPFTYPIEPLDGFWVAGFGTPISATDIAYPLDALQLIGKEYPEYRAEIPVDQIKSSSPTQIFEIERTHQARQVQIASDLAQNYSIDVLVINLLLPDHANHKMPTMELVQQAYVESDQDLDHLIKAFHPNNVMLISDHGSCRLQGDFLLNAWLRDQGYYVQKNNSPAERSAELNWLLVQWLQRHHGLSGPGEKFLRRLIREGLFRIPSYFEDYFWNKVESVIPFARQQVYLNGQADYTRTHVFPGSVYSGLLYLNIAGRESNGIIPPEKKESIYAEIIAKLGQIEDPDTHKPLFTRMYTSNELYSGPAVSYAPDLILDSYDVGWNIRTSKHNSIPEAARNKYFLDVSRRKDFGWHSRQGIFVFSGPAFSSGPAIIEGHVMDIAGTLLHLYGVPVPEDYDGKVLIDLMASEINQRPIRTQAGDLEVSEIIDEVLSTEEADQVIERLRALGYMD